MANKDWIIDGEDVKVTDGAVVKWDDHKFFSIEHHGKVFHGEVIDDNTEGNVLTVKINHRVFSVSKKGELDDLIKALGLDKPKIKLLKELEAPMPGRIVNIAVEIGQELVVGDEILSLEAMKMENVLKAEGIGKVKRICFTNDDVVDKGAVLIEFE
jgi:acetyl/propionyl-CoA carboxylase alpha subunit